jgi:hypothetical protein
MGEHKRKSYAGDHAGRMTPAGPRSGQSALPPRLSRKWSFEIRRVAIHLANEQAVEAWKDEGGAIAPRAAPGCGL